MNEENITVETGITAGFDYDFELSQIPEDVIIPW